MSPSPIVRRKPVLLIELHGMNRAVARALQEVGYAAHVYGNTRSVADSPWDAHVAAIPKERQDANDLVVTATFRA